MQCMCTIVSAEAVSDDGLFGECYSDPEARYTAVDGGESFTVAVSARGEVVGWGSAFYGELGSVEEQDQSEHVEPRICILPTRIVLQQTCTAVTCGLNHVLALASDGRVVAWGSNRKGQLAQPLLISTSARPAQISLLYDVAITAVAAGGSHSMALSRDGSVWTWGDNQHGQLGRSTLETSSFTPDSPRLPKPAASIAAGYAHSAFVDVAGSLFTFGWGLYHQLGHGSTEDTPHPRRVEAFDGIDGGVTATACGLWHTAAISSQGDVYTWGWGPDGQLGPSQGASQSLPSLVDTDDGYFNDDDRDHDAVQVACGARFTLVRCRGGEVLCWGKNALDSTQDGMKKRVKTVAAGHLHAMLLIETDQTTRRGKEDGDLKQ